MSITFVRKVIVILAHAFVGWALCFATMGIGMQTMRLQNALIVHAIAAPVVFGLISLIYFKRPNYTTPIQTALIFTSFVILMDFFVVALLIEKSFVMFTSPIGTWIPFASIFLSTYTVGILIMGDQTETVTP